MISRKPRKPLDVHHPDLAQEWHGSLNGDLKPHEIGTGSKEKVWWQCKKGTDHVWRASVSSRVAGRGCPFCAGYKVSYTNSLATTFPDIAAQWHSIKNGELTPQDVVHGSNKKVFWKCSVGEDHEWYATIVSRTRLNAGCPQCRGLVASAANNLELANPTLAGEWHPKLNGSLRPIDVTPMSKKKAWWLCSKGPDHFWQAEIGSRNAGRGCPYCAGVKVSCTNSLEFLYPEIVVEWHPTKNNELTPNHVTAGSSTHVWWQCRLNSEHEWQAPPYDRVNNHGCPYCSGNRLSPENSLAAVAPHLILEWDSDRNSPITPWEVSRGTNQKFWWICSLNSNHQWKAPVKNRVNGSGCPECALPLHSSRSEVELYESIVETFPNEQVIQHARPLWLGKQHLDIFLPDIKIGIEYQGRQHFEPVEFFGGEKGFEQNLERDARKVTLCEENGCQLIVVRQGYNLDRILGIIERSLVQYYSER